MPEESDAERREEEVPAPGQEAARADDRPGPPAPASRERDSMPPGGPRGGSAAARPRRGLRRRAQPPVRDQYMSPCGIDGAPPAGFSSGMSVMRASVVSSSDAIDAAFCSATRSTFVGSMMPAWTMSTNSMVSAL